MTRFCIDCNHDRTAEDEGTGVVSFTPDPGWAIEFAIQLAGGETASDTEVRARDGSRWNTWTTAVIGWAVTERHYRPDPPEASGPMSEVRRDSWAPASEVPGQDYGDPGMISIGQPGAARPARDPAAEAAERTIAAEKAADQFKSAPPDATVIS